MHFVYILLTSDGTFYSGLTGNIHKRIDQHKKGLVEYTKYRLPVKVKWIGIFSNKNKAVKFEKYLKTGSGNAMFKKRLI